jgi:hypothetical protein
VGDLLVEPTLGQHREHFELLRCQGGEARAQRDVLGSADRLGVLGKPQIAVENRPVKPLIPGM